MLKSKSLKIDITKGVIFQEDTPLQNLLVRTEEDKEKLTEFINKKDCICKLQALWDLREYLLSNNTRGDIATKNIVQAYKNDEHIKLKGLIQEKFLQTFTQNEYQSFIRIFKRNNWTWEKLILRFNSDSYKRNIFQYVTCRAY